MSPRRVIVVMPKTSFRFDAALLNAALLTPDVETRFKAALQEHGASHVRVGEDEEGRTRVSFESKRQPLETQSTLAEA